MKRSIELDIIRGISIILVLFNHTVLVKPVWSPLLISILTRGGWVGVDLFFVLSGFLVSGLLFKEFILHKEVRILNFLIRRGFKIYPSYYLLLALTYFVPNFSGVSPPWQSVLVDGFYLSNYFYGAWGHTWSLAVEEHFYILLSLLIPPLIFTNRSKPFSKLPFILTALMIITLVLRVITRIIHPDYSPLVHYTPTHLRIDALGFGVLISYYYHFHRQAFRAFASRYKTVLLFAGFFLMLPPFFIARETSFFLATFGLSLVYLGAGAILIAFTQLRLPHTWVSRSIARIGFYSYSIYLWHEPFILYLLPILQKTFGFSHQPVISLLVYFPGAVLFGILSGIIIETTTLKIRDKLFPSRSSLPSVSAAD